MYDTEKMENRRVLGTGSGTGIGRGVALEFARTGAAVVLHCAHSEEGCRSAVDEIRKEGGTAEAFKADLGNIDECRDLASKVSIFSAGSTCSLAIPV